MSVKLARPLRKTAIFSPSAPRFCYALFMFSTAKREGPEQNLPDQNQ